MNKSLSISKASIYLVLLIVALIIYVFVYFMPARSQLNMLQSEIALFNAESATYQKYLADPSALEADIDVVQAEIDRMNAEEYTNDSSVSFELSSAIQRYRLSVSAVTLGNPTTIDEYRALPINLTLTGDYDNIVDFIAYFENNQEGSYRAQGATVTISGSSAAATLLIYLCTPNV